MKYLRYVSTLYTAKKYPRSYKIDQNTTEQYSAAHVIIRGCQQYCSALLHLILAD